MFNVVPVFLTQHLIARKTRKRQILLGLFQKSNITKLVGSLKIYTMRTVDVFITVSILVRVIHVIKQVMLKLVQCLNLHCHHQWGQALNAPDDDFPDYVLLLFERLGVLLHVV